MPEPSPMAQAETSTPTYTSTSEPTSTDTPAPSDSLTEKPKFTPTLTVTPSSPEVPFDCTTIDEPPSTECDALVALYNSTDGSNWITRTNWLETDSPCDWYRVECHDGSVRQLLLTNNGLNGEIPPQLGGLTNLIALTLGGNKLSGPIPPQLGNLKNLQRLQLQDNPELSGRIPDALGELEHLRELVLSFSNLSGPLPVKLMERDKLEILRYHTTQICDPDDVKFQAWLETLQVWQPSGQKCDAASEMPRSPQLCMSITETPPAECEALAGCRRDNHNCV